MAHFNVLFVCFCYNKVARSELYRDTLPLMSPPTIVGDKPHSILRDAINQLSRSLEGYKLAPATLLKAQQDFIRMLSDPRVSFYALEDVSISVSQQEIDK